MESSSVTIYQALLKAADHIELNPQEFSFMEWRVPSMCGSPGCALGWVGFFAKIDGDANTVAVAMGLTFSCADRTDMAFYHRMDRLMGSNAWMDSAKLCAAGLRLYADKYHGHETMAPRNFASEMEAMLSAPNSIRDMAVSEELTWA